MKNLLGFPRVEALILRSADYYTRRLKFCAALKILKKEAIKGSLEEDIYNDLVINVICAFIYYEAVTPQEEIEAFVATLKEKGFYDTLKEFRSKRI